MDALRRTCATDCVSAGELALAHSTQTPISHCAQLRAGVNLLDGQLEVARGRTQVLRHSLEAAGEVRRHPSPEMGERVLAVSGVRAPTIREKASPTLA